jgi:hypothetical protein
MRKAGRTLVLAATAAAVAVGMTTPALAATARHEPVSRSAVAFTPGSGQSVVDWNRELITILGTPGAQPATVHPTRSFAILQAAEYDAVTSITHAAPSYLFSVPAPRGAPPGPPPAPAPPGRTPPLTRPRTTCSPPSTRR